MFFWNPTTDLLPPECIIQNNNASGAKCSISLIICMLLSLLRHLSALQCPRISCSPLSRHVQGDTGTGRGMTHKPHDILYGHWSVTMIEEHYYSNRPPITHPLAQSEFRYLSMTTRKIPNCQKEQADKELTEIKVVTKPVKHFILPWKRLRERILKD